jgi:hypothetical protein
VRGGEYSNLVWLLRIVCEAMFPVNPPGPATLQFTLQWFGFASSAERLALNIPH